MITITITVENLTDVLTIFSKIELLRYNGSSTPLLPINELEYATIANGIDQVNNRTDVSNVLLSPTYTQYYFIDPEGDSNSWYISRYANNTGSTTSGWSDPIQGDEDGMFYNPMYPSEVTYDATDKQTINKLRLFTGDPINLHRAYGEEALAYFHTDSMVFELQEKGWPVSINIYGRQYTSSADPSVNGYKYLKFNTSVNLSNTTISGVQQIIDVWFYTFRYSDKQLMEAYDTCLPPTPLTASNCTQDIYLMQTAYDLLNKESWELAIEDGAAITDSRDTYNPSAGLIARDKLLARLKKQLDEAVKSRRFIGLGGVRID